MKITPNELANTCAVFAALATARIPQHELQDSVRKTLLLDSSAVPSEIISDCIECRLLELVGGAYVLTPLGRSLGKLQATPRPVITTGAREFLLKRVYLNPEAPDATIGQLLLEFQPDVASRTFVFNRRVTDTAETIQGLQKMNALGLIDVDLDTAWVRSEYLALVNSCLALLREGAPVIAHAVSSQAQAVGSLAEELAMDYERDRLTRAGYSELAPLVQQISLVDQYAGYDIVSCRGTRINPENRIYIEVKGTRNPDVSLIWSYNERSVAERKKRDYWLYIYTSVDLSARSADGPKRINHPIVSLERMGYLQQPIDVYVCTAGGCYR